MGNQVVFGTVSSVTTKVTDMTSMFQGAVVFDQDLDNWRVTKVTSFENMFQGAQLYNQDIDEWAVNAGTNFNNMFNGAAQFLQNLCDWQGHNFVTSEAGTSMFIGTKCPTTTVDADSSSTTGSVCCGCTEAETNTACL